MKKVLFTTAIILTTSAITATSIKLFKRQHIKLQNISLPLSLGGGVEMASAN